jgi:tRNA pseudouridine38-40 synthase
MSSRRIRLDLAYDGTEFAGWQWQPRGRTVQAVVEEVLRRLAGGREARLRAASRTDAGVHARQQVADARVESRLDDRQLERAFSRLLPADVRPLRVRTVDDGFHAGRAVRHKTYRYRLDLSPYGDPLAGRYAWHVGPRLDRSLLRAALAELVGRRDFTGFADSRCRVIDRVRHLERADLDERGETAFLSFRADGFLTYMVRNMVGTAVAIARGRLASGAIGTILATGDRRLAAAAAPARGLHLWSVVYEGESEADGRGG